MADPASQNGTSSKIEETLRRQSMTPKEKKEDPDRKTSRGRAKPRAKKNEKKKRKFDVNATAKDTTEDAIADREVQHPVEVAEVTTRGFSANPLCSSGFGSKEAKVEVRGGKKRRMGR